MSKGRSRLPLFASLRYLRQGNYFKGFDKPRLAKRCSCRWVDFVIIMIQDSGGRYEILRS